MIACLLAGATPACTEKASRDATVVDAAGGFDIGVDTRADSASDASVGDTHHHRDADYDAMVGALDLLAPERSIAWRPGLVDGIPVYPEVVDVGTFGAVVDDGNDDAAAINAALAAAAEGTAVALSSGEYLIKSTLTVPSRRVLRGKGVEQTRILCEVVDGHCIDIRGADSGPYVDIAGDMSKGSSRVSASSIAGFDVGQYVELRQENDTSVFTCGVYGCQDWGARAVGQFSRVQAIDGNIVVLDPPLRVGLKAALQPRMRWRRVVQNAGVEDFYLERTNTTGKGHNIAMSRAVHSWVKNVWSQAVLYSHVHVDVSYGCEIRDSVFNDAHLSGGNGQGYGAHLSSRTTDTLVENNVFHHLRHSIAAQLGATGNVWAYNYSASPYTSDAPNWIISDMCIHGHYPSMNLFEGNVVQHVVSDNIWGTNGPNVFFRNRVLREAPGIAQIELLSHVHIHENNPMQSVVGNEIGVVGQSADRGALYFEADSAASKLDHANYDHLEGRVANWDTHLPRNLPPSLFLTSKPSFLGSTRWPPFGPDVVSTPVAIPAQARFEKLRDAGKIYDPKR